MSEALEGGCTCGAVRYRLESRPIVVHACHCRVCQRMTGSAFGFSAMIEADRLTVLGEESTVPVPVPSSHPKGQVWHRCPRCSIVLWSLHPELGPAVPLINVGTLDASERVQPDVHCWTASKHPWIVLPEGVPAFPGNYDSDAVWSEEAKARLAAVFS